MNHSKKACIAVDIDDVLGDSTDVIREIANELGGLQLTREHFQEPLPYWRYYETVMSNHGITDETIHKQVEIEWLQASLRVAPVAGAIAALRQLSEQYKIVLLTARNPVHKETTEVWLKQHFDGLYDELHLIGNFKVVEKPLTKGEMCKKLGAKWLIDDNPEHCMSAIDQGVETVLFGDYGWQFDAPKHLHRCKNWDEVLRYFDVQG